MTIPKRDVRFDERSERHGNVYRRVAIAKCRSCGRTDQVSLGTGGTLLPPVAVAKKFSQRGWQIGANVHWHYCPTCLAARIRKSNAATPINKAEEVEVVKVEPLVKADPPRTMQREDRRIIFDKLNGVYLDEKRGYETGWSDHKVAADLGVPRVWVEQVREEMFGPIATNPEIGEFNRQVAELAEIKTQLSSLAALKGQISNIETVLKGVNVDAIKDRLVKLEKLADEVKKHFPG